MAREKDHEGLVRQVLNYIRDPGVAIWRKALGLGGVLYVVWPLDVIPDFLPVIGWLDDIGVMGAVAWFVVRDIRRHSRRQLEARSREWPRKDQP